MNIHTAELRTARRPRHHGRGIAPNFIQDQFLNRSMEATAHNLDQFNPSPEVDSLLEHLQVLAAQLADCPVKVQMLDFIEQTIASNLREGEQNLTISARADQLLTEVKSEIVTGVVGHVKVKAIAGLLRGSLEVLGNMGDHDAAAITNARNEFRDVRARIGDDSRLTSNQVRRDLGKAKTATLLMLVNA